MAQPAPSSPPFLAAGTLPALLNERALQRRLAFERLVADISAEFVNLGPDQIDAGIQHALAAIGQFTRADRSYIFSYSDDGLRVTSTHEWCAEGVPSQRERLQNQPLSLVPWFMKAIRQQPAVMVPSVAGLPEDAAADRAEWQAQGILSLLGVSMIHQGSLIGVLGLDAVTEPRVWDEDDQQVLQIVAGIIVNALQHKRAQAIAAGQRRFLELLATGGSFTETLHSLVRVIEEQIPGIQGLILLLDPDGLHLHVGAAASLPEDYLRSIEGLEIGPAVGSCGTACYRRDRVIVEDIATDPRWEGLRGLALRHGLRACWSEPVFAADGRVVGAFAMYYREPRGPGPVELQTIETAAHLVGIAVEHEQARAELARAYQTLERRVEDRTHELAALNAIAGAVSRSLDLESILYDALDKALEVMGMELGLACRIASPAEAGGDEPADWTRLVPLAHRGVWEIMTAAADRPPSAWPHLALPLGSRPVVEEMAGQRPSLYRDALLRQGVRLFISVPLISKGVLLGAIFLGSSHVRTITPDELSLLQAVGAQVAVAMENAGLYHDALHRQAETERRRQVAEGMREILASLNSNQPLEQILNDIVARASRLLGTDAGIIRRIEAGRSLAVREIGYGMPPELDQDKVQLFAATTGNAALANRRPVVIPDYAEYYRRQAAAMDPATREQYEMQAGHFAAQFRSAIRLPLVARNQIYGELALFSRVPRNFSDEDTGLALAIADQTALAIENALLRQQAAEAAAITERARLARELHDSVTQSLYSMTLYAEAAARLLTTGDEAQAAGYLRDLRDTSQEALREMRLLVFELRPPALEQIGLAGALEGRLKAVESRGGLATAFHVEGAAPPPWLSLSEQQELFTIAQEALNNAFKHAHPRFVSVAIHYGEQAVSLAVSDDGAGFDPVAARASGGMGLAGMAERAERIGAHLAIASSPGNGTTVTVDVPRPQGGQAH